MLNVGLKIRNERKTLRLSLKKLAERVGISTMTLQRIETGKTSPSVSVLAEIASHLRQPIEYFVQNKEFKIVVVREQDVPIVESSNMKLRVISYPGLTGKNVLVNMGEAVKGSIVDSHVENGHSLVYVIEGEAILEHDGVGYPLKEGDAVFYDARYAHSVRALSERHRFFSVFFKEETQKE